MATTDGAELRRRLLEEEQRTHGNHDYRRFHEGRFRYVLSLCRELVPSPDAPVLDVGRSFLTSVLATHYRDVTTLGFAPADDGHVAAHSIGALRGPHIAFDLNDARSPELWPKLGARFGLVVFAEVIEHLYAAPEFALGLLREALAPGGFLVCQTPNATSLTKRLKMILGQNPFERIRIDSTDPGHYREYTRDELAALGARVGLRTVRHEYMSYFDVASHSSGGALSSLARRAAAQIGDAFPSLRHGQTIVYQREPATG